MDTVLLVAAISAVLVVLGLASGLVVRSPLTQPMLAMLAGVLLGPVLGVLPVEIGDARPLLLVAELALAVLLFGDATRVDLRLVRVQGGIPARMLLLALPLTVLFGTVAGSLLLGLGVGAAAVLACLLAPTDAALGQSLLSDERVPRRVRQVVNVESGLNDGFVVPLLAVALVVAGAEASAGPGALALDVLQLVGVGVVVGGGIGAGVAGVLRAVGWRTLEPAARQVGAAATALAAWGGSELLGGNGFVAAFTCGIAFGALVDDADQLLEFAEDLGDLLALLTFLAFGALFVAPAADAVSLASVVLVVLSLTALRMLPVAVSLVGTGLPRREVAVLGWFGPRGLATVVFGLQVLELADEGALPQGERIFGVAALAVVASVVLHGASTGPLARILADDTSDALLEDQTG